MGSLLQADTEWTPAPVTGPLGSSEPSVRCSVNSWDSRLNWSANRTCTPFLLGTQGLGLLQLTYLFLLCSITWSCAYSPGPLKIVPFSSQYGLWYKEREIKSNLFLWFTAQSGVWGWLEGIGMKNGFEELSNEMGYYIGELGKLNVEMRGEDWK